MRQPYKLRVALKGRHGFAVLKTFKVSHDELAHETARAVLHSPKHELPAGATFSHLANKHIRCLDLSIRIADFHSAIIVDGELSGPTQKAFITSSRKDKFLTTMFRAPTDFEQCGPLVRLYPKLFVMGKASAMNQPQILVVEYTLSVSKVTTLVSMITCLVFLASVTLGISDHSLNNALTMFAALVSLMAVIQAGLLWSKTGKL